MTQSPALRADARRNRDRVLAAAIEVLERSPAAGMREVADASGVGRSTLYRHFPSRAALVDAMHAQVVGEAVGHMQAALADPAPSATTLRALAAGVVGVGRRALYLASLEPPTAAIRAAEEEAEATMAALVARLQTAGVVRADLPAVWPGAVLRGLAMSALTEVQRGTLPADAAGPLVADGLLAAVGVNSPA